MKKKIVSIFLVFLFFGCGVNDPVGTQQIPSLNVNDYMFSGEEGTEYWQSITYSDTDTNGVTRIKRADTAIYRIINRNYNHPLYGSCLSLTVSQKREGPGRVDTAYLKVEGDVMYSINSYGNETNKLELLRPPLQKGTNIKYANFPLQITDTNIPITVSAGLFNGFVAKEEVTRNEDDISVFTSMNEVYYAEGVYICKVIMKNTLLLKKTNKTSVSLIEVELIMVKKT